MGICLSKRKMRDAPSPTRASSLHPLASKPHPHHQTQKEMETAITSPLTQKKSQAAAAAAPAKKHILGTTSSSGDKEIKEQLEGPIVDGMTTTTGAAAADAENDAEAAATIVKQTVHRNGVVAAAEEDPQVSTTVRTSSCSKEEVESILIQCGRLSRNSSGAEARHQRSRKRSYDFDSGEKNVEEEEEREKPSFSRPSPHRHRHRRTPSREGDNGEHKRSGSRERGSGSSGGRRMSRSPGRRSDTLMAASSSNTPSVDRSRQPPGKMVSVPARDKMIVSSEVGCGGMTVRKAGPPSSAAAAEGSNKRSSENGGMRTASPRSRSPAHLARSCNENTYPQHLPPQPQSLSRSSSRKAEQSPYRRNPMVEIDGNIALRSEQPPPPKPNQVHHESKLHSSRKADDEATKKPPQSQQPHRSGENFTQVRRQEVTGAGNSNAASRNVREQLMSCRVKEQRLEQQQAVEEPSDASVAPKGGDVPLPSTGGLGADILNTRTLTRCRSSRRSSKDLDANPGFNQDAILNPASYTSLLLEDIHNYHHQQNGTASFSLPECVSKACSILEAVADLNSSSGSTKVSEASRSHAVKGYHSGAKTTSQIRGATQAQQVVLESEVVRKDDLVKPSLHKYATARDVGIDSEPQESAGSNSFVGQPWASPWEPNSVDSTDRCWTSSWSNNERDNTGGAEEFISPDSHEHHHPKHQRSGSGGHEASARRSKSGVGVANSSLSAAATTSNGKKSESGRQHQPLPPGRGGGSIVMGGNAKLGGV